MTSKLTPESVAKLLDDELRLEVARKRYSDYKEYCVDPRGVVHMNSGTGESRKFTFLLDPLSNGEAHKLMVEYKIEPTFNYPNKDTVCCFVEGTDEDNGIQSAWHPATEHGTQRAICEAYLLMEG